MTRVRSQNVIGLLAYICSFTNYEKLILAEPSHFRVVEAVHKELTKHIGLFGVRFL